jgi:hypothetical protein
MKKSEVLQLFLDLCRIDSPSGEEKSVGDYVIKHLARHKIRASRDAYGNVIAKVAGEGKPLVISAHLDTVEPGRGVKPVVRNGVVRPGGQTILGADDKAGLTAAIAVAAEAVGQGWRIRPLELVFTRQEETDLDGVYHLDWSRIRAREGLILDGSDVPGRITIASPYIYNIDIQVKGRAAHAGRSRRKDQRSRSRPRRPRTEARADRPPDHRQYRHPGRRLSRQHHSAGGGDARKRGAIPRRALSQIDVANRAFKRAVRRGAEPSSTSRARLPAAATGTTKRTRSSKN